MSTEIGSRIRKYREDRSLRRSDLAKMLGVSLSCVSNWELGENGPAADHLWNLCRALQVSPSELLGVQLVDGELSEQERRLISAYRDKPELQNAVNILLGIDAE